MEGIFAKHMGGGPIYILIVIIVFVHTHLFLVCASLGRSWDYLNTLSLLDVWFYKTNKGFIIEETHIIQ